MSGNTSRYVRNLAHHHHHHHRPPIPRSYSTTTTTTSLHTTTCASSTPLSDKYLTNGGTVEGVWLFHRHGDRAPNRPLCADHMIESESSFWRTKIPHDDDAILQSLNERFPPNLHSSHDQFGFLDAKRAPFGRLTDRGMEQMRTVGERFGLRYDQYGHHAARRRKDQVVHMNGRSRHSNTFLDYWDVNAYSTNYLRTITSAQSFLDGVFGSTNSSSSSSNMDYISRNEQVPINVRDRTSDTLNAFDREPTLMRNLVSQVMSCPKFTTRDAKAAPLAARLANFLPGLNQTKKKISPANNNNDTTPKQQPNIHGETPPPSNINWIHATDHFVCRSSHAIPYTAYSAYSTDESVESTLAAMATPTLAHLAWRFRQWYLHKPLLSAIAAPPLREIERQICGRGPFLGLEERRPFVVYSCHDVTLLSLLYGIGADFLVDSKSKKTKGVVNGYDKGNAALNGEHNDNEEEEEEEWGSWRWWPAYASTLAFELVRVDEKNTGLDNSHIIRIFLNGRPLKVVDPALREDDAILLEDDYDWRKDNVNGSFINNKALSLEDFSRIVSYLERIGGRGGGEEDDDVDKNGEEERDMSIWTG